MLLRTVDQMLNGKEFNRATRAFALAYEALSVSWLSAFFSWCNENDLIKSFSDTFWSDLSRKRYQNSNLMAYVFTTYHL
jgi:uncharacterized protein (DUF1697 family)